MLCQKVSLNRLLKRSDQAYSRNMTYCVTKLTRQELASVQATAVGPLKNTLLTVKLHFIVLVTRHTEQADIPSAEGSVGHKASSAGATRSFHGQQDPVARCRAVHFNVSRAAQFLSN